MAYNFSPNSPKKSKYLRDPNEKKQSKYLRDKNGGKPKSKYARNPYEEKEHHYNLARYYRDGVRITDEQPEEAVEAVEAEELNTELEQEIKTNAFQQSEVVDVPEEKSVEEAVLQDNAPQEIPENAAEINETSDDAAEIFESVEEENPLPEMTDSVSESENESETKGDVASLFKHSKLSKETTVAKVASAEETKQKIVVKSVIVLFILTAFACALQFAPIKIKYITPSMINIEFSLLPEFIASLAYGPIFGIIIILIKNIIYSLVTASVSNLAYASVLSGVVLDTVFVIVSGTLYSKRMFGSSHSRSRKKRRARYRKKVLVSGLVATAVVTVVSYFLTTYVSYPLIIKQFISRGVDEYFILRLYQVALNNLNSFLPSFLSGKVTEFANLNQGIIFYNMPLTVFKHLAVTLLAVIIYPPLSPYIHFRKKTK